MTEQMAQRWLEQFEFPTDENSDDALATICEALQEYPKFRAIGTVEELQALKEKSVAKKPRMIRSEIYDSIIHYYCPNCGRRFGERGEHNAILFKKDSYCQGCGQLLDWE